MASGVIKEIWNDWQSGELNSEEALEYMLENIKDAEVISGLKFIPDAVNAMKYIEQKYCLEVFN